MEINKVQAKRMLNWAVAMMNDIGLDPEDRELCFEVLDSFPEYCFLFRCFGELQMNKKEMLSALNRVLTIDSEMDKFKALMEDRNRIMNELVPSIIQTFGDGKMPMGPLEFSLGSKKWILDPQYIKKGFYGNTAWKAAGVSLFEVKEKFQRDASTESP